MGVVLTPQVFVGKFSVEVVYKHTNQTRFHLNRVEKEIHVPNYFRADMIVVRKVNLLMFGLFVWWCDFGANGKLVVGDLFQELPLRKGSLLFRHDLPRIRNQKSQPRSIRH